MAGTPSLVPRSPSSRGPPPRARAAHPPRRPLLPRTKLNFQRPLVPAQARSCHPGESSLHGDLPRLVTSPNPSGCRFTAPPQTLRTPPRPPSPPGAAAGSRPHPSPPSPVSRAQARQAGAALAPGCGRPGSLTPPGRSAPAEEERRGRVGCSSRIRLGLLPSAATSEPQTPPPRLHLPSSGNR